MINKKSFITRTLSGVVLLLVMITMIVSCKYSFALMLGIISFGALFEYNKIAKLQGVETQLCVSNIMMLVVFGVNALFFLEVLSIKWLVLIIPAMLLPFISELYRNRDKPLLNIASSISGVVYCSLGTISLMYVSGFDGEYSAKVMLGYMILVWTNDVGAYLVGMSIGKHRLFERLSPKKSWEGFYGGVVFCVAIAIYFAYLQGYSYLFGAGLGLIISISGVLGDLIESMFKRSVDMKDSGNIIPGHGGFLDRFDALLISAPLTLIYFIIFT